MFNGFRTGFGSGGSTAIKGLDYRFDISRSSLNGFIDDVNTKTLDISTQLNYRVNDSFKVWGALEYKKDNGSAYWGTPLVSATADGIDADEWDRVRDHTNHSITAAPPPRSLSTAAP